MRDDDVDVAVQSALVRARREGACTEPRPGWAPRSLDGAYRLQRAIAAELGAVAGWKISGLTHAQQAAMGVDRPLAAPLLQPWLRPSGAAFEWRGLVQPRLECEFAFELRHDLAPRAHPYTRSEVEDAIASVRIGIEIVDSRLPAGSPVWLELADNLNNGGYVVGPPSSDWRALRYEQIRIALRRVGNASEELAHGDGRAVLDGDPVGAVVLLANLAEMRPHGLHAGDLVTTGSCTGAVAIDVPGDFVADFGGLGSVHLRLIA